VRGRELSGIFLPVKKNLPPAAPWSILRIRWAVSGCIAAAGLTGVNIVGYVYSGGWQANCT